MGFSVTFDEPARTARVKQSGDCDFVDAMNAFEGMRAAPGFRRTAKVLVDLSECYGERTLLEVEAISGHLCALFRGRYLAFVRSDDLVQNLDYATEVIRRDGAVDARVFATAPDAEAWLRTVN